VVPLGRLREELPDLARRPQPPELREAWVPTRQRSLLKRALAEQWDRPELARLRDRAQLVYQEFLAASGQRAPAPPAPAA